MNSAGLLNGDCGFATFFTIGVCPAIVTVYRISVQLPAVVFSAAPTVANAPTTITEIALLASNTDSRIRAPQSPDCRSSPAAPPRYRQLASAVRNASARQLVDIGTRSPPRLVHVGAVVNALRRRNIIHRDPS
jgi:hypothetical protein